MYQITYATGYGVLLLSDIHFNCAPYYFGELQTFLPNFNLMHLDLNGKQG